MNEKNVYLTPAGLRKIQSLYRELLRRQAQGDRLTKTRGAVVLTNQEDDSDPNVEVTEKDLLLVQIKRYESILKHYQLILPPRGKERNRVGLGAKLIVEIEKTTHTLFIVDAPEANPDQGKISRFSPIAKALMGRKLGEEVKVHLDPPRTIKIKKIKY